MDENLKKKIKLYELYDQKMFICDVVNLAAFKGSYFHGRIPIRSVELVGHVFDVVKKPACYKFILKDGTGNVICFYDFKNNHHLNNIQPPSHNDSQLEKLYKESMTYLRDPDLYLGQCVRVTGWVNSYYDEIKIKVFKLSTVDSAWDEMSFRMDALVVADTTLKSKPDWEGCFGPPKRVRMASLEALKYLTRRALSNFTTDHLIKDHSNAFHTHTIHGVLRKLMYAGHVYLLSQKRELFQMVDKDEKMKSRILQILKQEDPERNGMSIYHLFQRLRNPSNIRYATVMRRLTTMEGDVIGIGEQKFILG